MADLPQRIQPGDDVTVAFNNAMDALDSENRTKIIKNMGVSAVLFGYQLGGFGTGDYGLKIAKPGIDVTTAAQSQLAFTSARSTLAVAYTFTTTQVVGPAPVGGGTTNVTQVFTHALGVVPYAICTGSYSSGGAAPAYFSTTFEASSNANIGLSITDLNTITVGFSNGSASTYTFNLTCNLLTLT